MPDSANLHGRASLVQDVRADLTAGRSVLLFGPEGIGKSAVIAAAAVNGVVIVDPFEHVSRQRAFHIRRDMDRGAVYLAASRVSRGRHLGAVGRILWRFSLLRVRELSAEDLRTIVIAETGDPDANDGEAFGRWVNGIVALSKGRPGYAVAMARVATDWRRQRGYLPAPAFAFAAARGREVPPPIRLGRQGRATFTKIGFE